MQRARTTNWPEAGVAVTTVALYVTARLLREESATSQVLRQLAASGIPAIAFEHGIAEYQLPLHLLLPVLGGAALLLLAWAAGHYLALPRLVRRTNTTLPACCIWD